MAEVIGKTDLVERAALHDERSHPRRHERSRLDRAARRRHRHPLCGSIRRSNSASCRRDLTEQLRLELGQVGERPRHAAGRVMLGESVGGQNVRVRRRLRSRPRSGCRDAPFDPLRDSSAVRVETVDHRRFEGLVVRRQRTVLEAARDPDPADTVRVHDERLIAGNRRVAARRRRRLIRRRLGPGEVGRIESRPRLLSVVPPHQLLAVAPRPAVGSGRGPVVENAPIVGPRESPPVTVGIARLPFGGAIARRLRETPE